MNTLKNSSAKTNNNCHYFDNQRVQKLLKTQQQKLKSILRTPRSNLGKRVKKETKVQLKNPEKSAVDYECTANMFNDIFNAIESQKINAVKVYPETDYSLMDSTYNDLLEFLQIKEEKIIADVENDLMETTYNQLLDFLQIKEQKNIADVENVQEQFISKSELKSDKEFQKMLLKKTQLLSEDELTDQEDLIPTKELEADKQFHQMILEKTNNFSDFEEQKIQLIKESESSDNESTETVDTLEEKDDMDSYFQAIRKIKIDCIKKKVQKSNKRRRKQKKIKREHTNYFKNQLCQQC